MMIVLLILAGITIGLVTGENGLLAQATRAKEETTQVQEDELRRLTALEAATNLENTTYEDENGQMVIIPAGFAVSQIEGENTVNGGLVIIDANGNEFVWIPVKSEDGYVRNTTYEDTNVSSTAYTDTGYLPKGIQPEKDESESNEEAEREAVVSKGGFYVSRYEAGKEGENTLVSKKGATVWNNISQADCKTEAKKFINNENVKSALCSGIQWDVMMAFVNGKKDGSSGENITYDVTQTKTYRHTGILEEAGQNEKDRVCNIYDLEGNVIEYVAERGSYYSSGTFNDRGGFYNNTSNILPASYRNQREWRSWNCTLI